MYQWMVRRSPTHKGTYIMTTLQLPWDEYYRIVAALPTINYILEHGASSLVIMSHLGRPDGMRVDKYSLAPVSEVFQSLLGR